MHKVHIERSKVRKAAEVHNEKGAAADILILPGLTALFTISIDNLSARVRAKYKQHDDIATESHAPILGSISAYMHC
jgi:hypothetical protein